MSYIIWILHAGCRQWMLEGRHWQIREEYNESECQNPRNVIYSTTAYLIYILLSVYVFINNATHQYDSVTPLDAFPLASTRVITRFLVVFPFTPTSYLFQTVSKIMYQQRGLWTHMSIISYPIHVNNPLPAIPKFEYLWKRKVLTNL